MTDKTFIHILDSTLRDGSHALSHQFTAEQVRDVAGGLDDAGVEMIEVSHGDGLGGSTITYGFQIIVDCSSGLCGNQKGSPSPSAWDRDQR